MTLIKRINELMKQHTEMFTKFTFMLMAINLPYKDEDLCKSAKDFLLEPCILIQLPWTPILLHQWLVAALAEVLLFEKSSVELRHWPIPKLFHSCASELPNFCRANTCHKTATVQRSLSQNGLHRSVFTSYSLY